MRTMIVLLSCMLALGLACNGSQTGAPNDQVSSQARYAFVQSAPNYKVILVSEKRPNIYPPSADSNYLWKSLELQDSDAIDKLSATGALTVDLSLPAAVTFTLNYPDGCGACTSPDEAYTHCWLTVHYKAGDPGLQGTVSVRTGKDGLVMAYDFVWQGLTDRHGCGYRPGKDIVHGSAFVPPENITEVQQ